MSKFQFIKIDIPKKKEPKLNQDIMNLILRRRKQMLVHSIIYYKIGTNIIEDITFDKWAYELRDLQKSYPKESEATEYYKDFKDWDGTTGFNLPEHNFRNIAEMLIEYTRGLDDK